MKSFLVCAGAIAASINIACADEIAGPPKGYIEAGTGYDALTSGYPDRHTVFVRGEYRMDDTQRFTAEANEISQFGSTGPLFVGGYENDFSPDWILQLGGAFSPGSGGDTLPRNRVDASLGKKWLEAKNLVTTLGLTNIQYKNAYVDHALQASAAYYFEYMNMPLAIEGGAIYNLSYPGANGATQYYSAINEGREMDSIVSVRIGGGNEAYQLVGNAAALQQFSSNSLLVTWRKWLTREYGFQLRADTYNNPYYQQRGVEASWFKSF